MTVLVFSEVPPYNDHGYISCDGCGQNGLADTGDLCDGKDAPDMYYLYPDGIYVCQHCFGEIDL